MKTVRRLLYRDIAWSVLFATLAFLSLLFFFDIVDQMGRIGRGTYTLMHGLLIGLLWMPGHFYELFPIMVLIGSIYSLSRLAQSSEYTILRTAGLAPGRALALLSVLGALFAAITLLVGDFVVPVSEHRAQQVRVMASGGKDLEGGGAWLRDRVNGSNGERHYTVNVKRLDPRGVLQDVRIFEFDEAGRLLMRLQAASATADEEGLWLLREAMITHWLEEPATLRHERHAEYSWQGNLKASVVTAAVFPVVTMSSVDLWRYSQHLSQQEQASQMHSIAFWKKALYPLACFVMLGLALPFAYLHARGGDISWKVFGGIMLGISFVLVNHLSSHLGVLNGWSPFVAAVAPSAVYLSMSLAAFAWLVRYR